MPDQHLIAPRSHVVERLGHGETPSRPAFARRQLGTRDIEGAVVQFSLCDVPPIADIVKGDVCGWLKVSLAPGGPRAGHWVAGVGKWMPGALSTPPQHLVGFAPTTLSSFACLGGERHGTARKKLESEAADHFVFLRKAQVR